MMVRIFRHFVPASVMMLAVCELTIVYLVWRFLFLDPATPNAIFHGTVGSPALIFSLLAVGIMAGTGLYHNKAFLNLQDHAD